MKNLMLSNKLVTCRPPRKEEIQFIRWLWADEETMNPLGGPITLSDREAESWCEKMVEPGRTADLYLLILNEYQQPVGEISYHRLDHGSMMAEFNLKIAYPERRKGYAKMAMLPFLDYFFNHLGGRILFDDVALDNNAGQQALIHFGFQHDSGFKDACRLKLTKIRFNDLYGTEQL